LGNRNADWEKGLGKVLCRRRQFILADVAVLISVKNVKRCFILCASYFTVAVLV
jgi:hypothetical protein